MGAHRAGLENAFAADVRRAQPHARDHLADRLDVPRRRQSVDSSRPSVTVRAACCVSTVGVSPDTVMLSSRLPTFISTLMVATKFVGSSTASRIEVEKPGQRERQLVSAGPQIDDRVAPRAVGHGRADLLDQHRTARLRR